MILLFRDEFLFQFLHGIAFLLNFSIFYFNNVIIHCAVVFYCFAFNYSYVLYRIFCCVVLYYAPFCYVLLYWIVSILHY